MERQLTVVNGPVWEHLAFQFGELNRNADSLNRYVDFRQSRGPCPRPRCSGGTRSGGVRVEPVVVPRCVPS